MQETLIDKGSHLEDANGTKYAKGESVMPKKLRKKKCVFRAPAEWDTIYLAFGEVVKGRLTVPQLSKITGVPAGSIHLHAKNGNWKEKWATALEAQGEAPTAIQTVEKISQFQAQHPGGVDWLENLHSMFKKSGKHLKKMKPAEVLENSGRIKDLNTVARQTYGMDTDEEKSATNRPAINIQFLMQATAEPIVSNG